MKFALDMRRIRHCYGNRTVVLDNFSLAVRDGEIACLLGPSGCGKTTALRVIAGFESLLEGEVHVGGNLMSSSSTVTPPEKRNIGIVFQEAALFPHLTIARNIGFGLRSGDKLQNRERVAELLKMTGLIGHENKYPHQLSGGQRQRAALARAMAPKPSLILLDEPFSNLDADLRYKLSGQIRAILNKNRMTAVLVTHDQSEAFAMADRVCVMNRGKIHQYDTPYNLFHRPATKFVAGFLGEGDFLPGTYRSGAYHLPLGEIPAEGAVVIEDQAVEVLIRPDDLVLDPTGPIEATIADALFRGAGTLYQLKLPNDHTVKLYVPGSFDHKIGQRVNLRLSGRNPIAFPKPDA